MSDLITENSDGLLVNPTDPNEWATAIIELLQDPSHGDRMGAEGLKKVTKSYTIQKVCDDLENLYITLESQQPTHTHDAERNPR
jgi:glycosyltransferase involved in cell wall biosynthesis